MSLREVLNGVTFKILQGSLDVNINDIKYDSRKVKDHDIYVALNGFNSDGHEYIDDAINNGAKVIITAKIIKCNKDVTVIKVDDTRLTLAYISKNYFNHPDDLLKIIGVTGTAGKTTTTHMIREMLLNSGIKCGLIGSNGTKYNDIVIPTCNTTPESYEIFKAFREMVDSGINCVAMETSSQAFKLNRLAGIVFDIGVLTNITTDHIGPGEHDNQEDYVNCKKKLFLNSKKVIVNNDSLYLNDILKGIKVPITTYGINNSADLKVNNIKFINEENFLGSSFEVVGKINETFKISIPGEFNVYNALSALAVCTELNTNIEKCKEALLNVKVRGRMEIALSNAKFKVLIDYAHTSDEMDSLVKTLKMYKPKRLVSVFGGGGNRAKERRYSLGEIIGAESDLCIITMDNPRFEDVSSINNDIKVGLNKVNAKYIEIEDRSLAIKYAINNALDGDIIVLIGKGHEEYQDIKGVKYHFSEKEVIEEIKKNLS